MFHLTDLSRGMRLVALLPFLFHWGSSTHQLYQTSHTTASGQFDCLPYVNVWEQGGGLLETNTHIESGYFCRQAKSASTKHTVLHDSPMAVSGLRFTFERLRAMSVTADDLVPMVRTNRHDRRLSLRREYRRVLQLFCNQRSLVRHEM